ncbi:ABC transporter permease, partial [Kitasatospora sp. NPDC059571]
LRTAAALARRLQRAGLAGWAAGFAVAGAVFGGVAKGVVDLVGGNAQVAAVVARLGGRQGVLDAYSATLMSLFGMAAAGYAVQAVLRLRAEETSGRAEPVLATAVGRLGWAAGHLLYALLGPVVLLACAGVAVGLGEGAALGGPGAAVGRLLPAALVQLPAVWLTAAVAAALFGLAPERTAAGWGVLGAFVLVSWLGPVLQLPRAVLDLSPFSHVPHLPGGEVAAAPLLWTTVLAAGCAAAGLAGLRRRDIG